MLKTTLVSCALLLTSTCYASSELLSASMLQDVASQSSPEIQASLEANPNLLAGLAARVNLAYKTAYRGNQSSINAASSMVTSYISSQKYAYRMPSSLSGMNDCSVELALSQMAAQDALNTITNYNLSRYAPEDNLPPGSRYNAMDIIAGVLQGAMIAGVGGITADQVAIGTYKVCNDSSQKALSYMTTITNLTNTLFNAIVQE